jgi:hypothetical protein
MTTPFTMVPGRALYMGRQNRQNEVVDQPPEPYLLNVDDFVATRGRYAAHIGVLPTAQGQLSVVLYVDTETHHVYAQPHPENDPVRVARWREDAIPEWSHETSRRFVRWLELHASHVDKSTPRKKLVVRLPSLWSVYIAGNRPDKPPKPLALAVDPESSFAETGWIDWEDWFWPPRRVSTAAMELATEPET